MDRRWLFLTAILFAGCSEAPKPEPVHEPPKQVSTDFGRLKSVLEGVRKPAELALYPGLPSEFWEPQLREQEASQKKTVRLQGYLFYDDRKELMGEDADRLSTLLSTERTFQRFRGSKTCSGYEPDYCIEWKSGNTTTQILICLGCGEVKIFGPKTELYCDLSAEAGQKLDQWLKPYQKYQPPAASG